MLVERLDFIWVSAGAHCLPACKQFRTVHGRPEERQFQGARRKGTGKHLKGIDSDAGCEFRVFGVEMSAGMVQFRRAEGNLDSVKSADRWHGNAGSAKGAGRDRLSKLRVQLGNTFRRKCSCAGIRYGAPCVHSPDYPTRFLADKRGRGGV